MTPTQLLAASLARIQELENEVAEKTAIYEAAKSAAEIADRKAREKMLSLMAQFGKNEAIIAEQIN